MATLTIRLEVYVQLENPHADPVAVGASVYSDLARRLQGVDFYTDAIVHDPEQTPQYVGDDTAEPRDLTLEVLGTFMDSED